LSGEDYRLAEGLKVTGDRTVCVPKTSSTSGDQAVFVDRATGVSLPSDAVPVEIDRYGEGFQRRGCVRGAVRPVLIVVDLVRVQDPPQMGLVPDEWPKLAVRRGWHR